MRRANIFVPTYSRILRLGGKGVPMTHYGWQVIYIKYQSVSRKNATTLYNVFVWRIICT
jgi:hypothetical protein